MRRFLPLLCTLLLLPLFSVAQPTYEYFSRPGWFRAFAYPAPSQPANVSALTVSATTIAVSWNASDFGTGILDHYNVYWCQPSPSCTLSVQATQTELEREVTGLSSGVTYRFAVSAVNSEGRESVVSSVVTASLNDLVGYWPFEGDCADESITNNDCTTSGNPTYTAGAVGQALTLDGTGDLATATNDAAYAITTNLTVVALAQCNSCAITDHIVAQDDGTNRRWALRIDAANVAEIEFAAAKSDVLSIAATTAGWTPTGWHMYAGQLNGTNNKLFIDTIERASGGHVGTIDQDDEPITIGARGDNTRQYTGKIDEVRIYNKVLSAADMQYLYTRMLPEVVGLYSSEVEENATAAYAGLGYSWANNTLGVSPTVPIPFDPLLRSDQTFAAWGRLYTYSNSLLPTQITSQGTPLFFAAPTFKVTSYGTAVGAGAASLTMITDTPAKMVFQTVVDSANFKMVAENTLEYDGFLRIDVRIVPKSPHTEIEDVTLTIPFVKAVAECTARYLPYDFEDQDADKQALLDASECIAGDDITYPHNPSAFFGNDTVGMEVVNQTNVDIHVTDVDTVNTISPEASSNDLIINLLDGPVKISEELVYSFALLPTPVKPMPDNWRTWHTVSSGGPVSNTATVQNTIGANWRVVLPVIYNHADIPLEFASLPAPDIGTEATFDGHVATLHATGAWVVPYGALFAMDTRIPEMVDWRSTWESSALRNGSWGSQLGFQPSTQPVAYDHRSLHDYVLQFHYDAITAHNLDGTYWDLANLAEIDLVLPRHFPTADTGTKIFYPIYSAREFLKRYWTMTKTLDSDFLIMHHGNRIAHTFCAWTDVCMTGEVFNNFFRLEGATTSGFPPVWDDPELYDPDYSDTSLIPRVIFPDEYGGQWGWANMILPQIRKFNDAYLNATPAIEEAYSRTMLGMLMSNDIAWYRSRYLATLRNSIAAAINKFGKLTNDVTRLGRIDTGTTTWAGGYRKSGKVLLTFYNDDTSTDTFTFATSEHPGLSGVTLTSATNAETDANLMFTGTTVDVSIPAKDFVMAVFDVTP